VNQGQIKISPFNANNINPNSYNLTLDSELLIYESPLLDAKALNKTQALKIGSEGLILQPGRLYLAKTQEYTETDGLVPVLYGRSSTGRLGLFVHVTAGFGDVGFKGNWTLELVATQPLRIYAGMKICQIVYLEPTGELVNYAGKYQNSVAALGSKMYEDT
jgi:dCTP deaminase